MSIFATKGILLYSCFVALVFGACMGSFLNCAAWRIAHGENFLKGRSHCPDCGHALGLWDLFPVISWLLLRGKCRYCGKKISARYPLTELFFGAVTVACLLKFDLTVLCLRNYIFLCCLFCLSLVDLESYIIPDGCLILAAAVWFVTLPFLGMGWKAILLSVAAAVVFGGGLLGISLILDKVLKKESLGGGDIKLFAVMGLYLGFLSSLFAVILACILGLFLGRLRKKGGSGVERIPFGPAIAAATSIMLLWGSGLAEWYLSLFRAV